MRYMLLMEYDHAAMPAGPPPAEVFESMGRYNNDLVDAGVLLAAEGLTGPDEGVRLTFDEPGDPIVTDGPFTEAKELVGGFWILDVASRDEALQWARRCPLGGGVTLWVRRVSDLADFAEIAPQEVLDAEVTLRRRISEREAERSRTMDTGREAERSRTMDTGREAERSRTMDTGREAERSRAVDTERANESG